MKLLVMLLGASLLAGTPVAAADQHSADKAAMKPATVWVTLGTQGGPIPTSTRSQPANAIVRGDGAITLVDVGDGAVEQLTRAGYDLRNVDTVFLSHLHFDHTAGMLGVLGLRYQARLQNPVRIYGPPGTRDFVAGLVASLKPFGEGGFGIVGEQFPDPALGVIVTELADGSEVTVGSMTVRAVQNTHYSFPAGSDLDKRFKSLSYRFNTPDRSIVFTGDTGPSEAVTALADRADLLVTEIIDVPKTLDLIARLRPDQPEREKIDMEAHQRTQHIEPRAIGVMASKAGVKEVVLTHFAPGDIAGGAITAAEEASYRKQIGETYKGRVLFAKDLDKF